MSKGIVVVDIPKSCYYCSLNEFEKYQNIY